jgi:hypothetical protein
MTEREFWRFMLLCLRILLAGKVGAWSTLKLGIWTIAKLCRARYWHA